MSESKVPRDVTVEERQLFLAEAKKAEAEAEAALTEAAKNRAETRKAELACVQQEAINTVASLGLRDAQIELARKEREEAEILAMFKYQHVYHFAEEVSEASVRNCMHRLNTWDRLDPKCSIEIVFASPGGDVVDGFVLFDYIQQLRRKGHKVTTSTLGYAASMAGVLLQAGDVRKMGKESWLLIHEASFGAGGKLGDVEDRVNWIKRICERIVQIYALRAADVKGKHANKVAAFIRKNWKRKDWWISSEEALEYGFVDVVE